MIDKINTFLLGGDKFMPEMHLIQPRFTYCACGPFTKNKETGDSSYIYQNELDKACFHHDMTYGDFKDLHRRTAFYKVLHDKDFNIAIYPRYDGYQCWLASKIYTFFDKKSSGANTSGGTIKRYIMSNQQLACKLHKLIIGKCEKT